MHFTCDLGVTNFMVSRADAFVDYSWEGGEGSS